VVVIVAEGVSKFYGDRAALKDVTFRIEPGTVVGLLGLNGAGKTTMLKILCGLLLPSGGHVEVDGVVGLRDPLALRRRIGFLPDRPPLYPELTVRQMLTHAGRLNGLAKARAAARVDEVLGLTDLQHVADDLIDTLSHGYRQRVGIAQAIVHEPSFVVLDEPISGLDPAQIVGMRALIRSLKDKHTVLLSSHILGEIEHTADRVLVLHGGRIVADKQAAELRRGGGQQRIEVLARGALAALHAANVLQLPGLADTSVTELEGGLLRVRADVDGDAAREALVAALVKHGFGVRAVAEREGDLEALFLRLTDDTSAAVPNQGGAA
jgi:ABC-2 type transport system ATP-binding protein